MADNPVQAAAAARLRQDARERQTLLEANVARRRIGQQIPIAVLDRGKVLMDELRKIIGGDGRSRGPAADGADRGRGAAVPGRDVPAVGQRGLGAGAGPVFPAGSAVAGWPRAAAAKDALDATNLELRREAELDSRETAEAQMRQMQKMEAVGQLTGGIAHDFNNMLAIVLGALDLAKRRLRTEPDKAEVCIDNAVDGAQRAAQLTSRLLAFSRQQPLRTSQRLDINKLVGGMSEMLRRTIGEDLRVETVPGRRPRRAFVDPGELENAVINLAVNARDAMPEGGHPPSRRRTPIWTTNMSSPTPMSARANMSWSR